MKTIRTHKHSKAVLLAVVALLFCLIPLQMALAKDATGDGAAVKISQVMGNQKEFLNKQIILNGKITMQCGSGCWFILNDGTGQIFVDLNPSNFTIPQKRGAMVKVFGKVAKKDGELFIIGKKVVF